jgi:ABC-2 type transport system permease protein
MSRLFFLAADQEFKAILRDWRLAAIMLLGPLVFGVIFGGVYSRGMVNELPMAIYDQDNSALSRQVIQAFDDSERFAAAAWVDNATELHQLIRQQRARLGIVIPPNFAASIKGGTPTQILTIYDTSNLVTGYNIKKSAQQVTMALNDRLGIEALTSNGIMDSRAKEAISPVNFVGESWYNPTNNYVVFIFIGIAALLPMQIIFVSSSLSLARDREMNCWIHYAGQAFPTAATVLGGRSLPYICSGMISFFLIASGGNLLIGMPLRGNIFLLTLFAFLGVLISTLMGFGVSSMCTNRLQPTRTVMLLSMPIFFGCGYVWPWDALPRWMQLVMATQPMTYATAGLRCLATKDAGWTAVAGEFWCLILLLIVYGVAAFYVFYHQKYSAE